MKRFDIKQINNLKVGNILATELPTIRESYKSFLVVKPHYKDYTKNMSKVINDPMKNEILFDILRCEIKEEFIDSYDVDYYIENEIRILNIDGIDKLEVTLSEYLEDFATLRTDVNHPYL